MAWIWAEGQGEVQSLWAAPFGATSQILALGLWENDFACSLICKMGMLIPASVGMGIKEHKQSCPLFSISQPHLSWGQFGNIFCSLWHRVETLTAPG